MIRFLRNLIDKCVQIDGEPQKIMRFVTAAAQICGPRVLDAGCGYGRYLKLIIGAGLNATGVEINPEIAAANRAAGLSCVTADEFEKTNEKYDMILMAHIIEHFAPKDLVHFMDTYLDHLKPGGRLIVATPLGSDYFYDDFDHIKPYQPIGLIMVFGESAAQVQYYARNQLALRDIWFRRSPLRISHARGRYLRTPGRFLLAALDLIAAAAYLLSGGLIGTTNGWVGVFEKTGEDR
jgi:SAM-dependent methyltransferase